MAQSSTCDGTSLKILVSSTGTAGEFSISACKLTGIVAADSYKLFRIEAADSTKTTQVGGTGTASTDKITFADTITGTGNFNYKVIAYASGTQISEEHTTAGNYNSGSTNPPTGGTGDNSSGGTGGTAASPSPSGGTTVQDLNTACVEGYTAAQNDKASRANQNAGITLFSQLNSDSVKMVYKWALSLVNFIVLIFLIVVAFANMIRLQVDNYAIKKIIPSLIMGVVLANFSWLICRFFIEIGTLLYHYVVGTAGGEGLFKAIAESYGLNDAKTACGGAASLGVFSGLLAVIAGTVLIVIAAVLILTLYVLLIARVWVVTLLVVLSPLAFIALAFPMTQQYFKKWWGMFFNWVFMAPASFLVLILATKMGAIGNGPNLTRYILVTALLYFAVQVPFKMGGSWMSQWGGYVSQFKKKTGGKVQQVAKGYGEEYSNRAAIRFGNSRFGRYYNRRVANKKITRENLKKEVGAVEQQGLADARRARVDKNWGVQLQSARTLRARRKAEAVRQAAQAKIDTTDSSIYTSEQAVKDRQGQLDAIETKIKAAGNRTARDAARKAAAADIARLTAERDAEQGKLSGLRTVRVNQEQDLRTAESNVSRASRPVEALKARLAGTKSFEADEQRVNTSYAGEESAKADMMARFARTPEGKKALEIIAYYTMLTASNKNAETEVAQQTTEALRLTGKGVPQDPDKQAQLDALARRIDPSKSGRELATDVQGFYAQADQTDIATSQATKADEAAKLRLAQERLAIDGYQRSFERLDSKVNSLTSEIAKADDEIERLNALGPARTATEEAMLKQKLQEKDLNEKMLRQTKLDLETSRRQRDEFRSNMQSSYQDIANLPRHIREMFRVGADGKTWEIEKMKGTRFTSTIGAVAGPVSKKIAEHRDNLTSEDRGRIMKGETNEFSRVDWENYRDGNISALDSDTHRKLLEYEQSLVMDATKGSATNPQTQEAVRILSEDRMTPDHFAAAALEILRKEGTLKPAERGKPEFVELKNAADEVLDGRGTDALKAQMRMARTGAMRNVVVSAITAAFPGRVTDRVR